MMSVEFKRFWNHFISLLSTAICHLMPVSHPWASWQKKIKPSKRPSHSKKSGSSDLGSEGHQNVLLSLAFLHILYIKIQIFVSLSFCCINDSRDNFELHKRLTRNYREKTIIDSRACHASKGVSCESGLSLNGNNACKSGWERESYTSFFIKTAWCSLVSMLSGNESSFLHSGMTMVLLLNNFFVVGMIFSLSFSFFDLPAKMFKNNFKIKSIV